MKKHKLIFIFDAGDEILDIESHLIFNNEFDAESFFTSHDSVKSVTINMGNYSFTIATTAGWKAHGSIHLSLDLS